MRWATTLVICGLMTTGAWASGGANCSSEGGPATIQVDASITRGMGGQVFGLTGSVETADTDVAEDLRKTAFEKEHLAQYWLDGEELRLLLYRERPSDKEHGYVELEIRTKAVPDEEGSYAGTYLLSFWDTAGGGDAKEKKIEGKIACTGE